MPGKKSRLAAGVAAAGACALLVACSPVKMGAAAIVGNDRITTASLDSDVSNLQQAVTQYGLQKDISASSYPTTVLTWLVRFAIQDKVAQDAGITVSQTDIQATLAQLDSQEQQAFQQQGETYPGLGPLLVANGVPPNELNDFGRWQAQQNDYLAKVNGGKLPATQAEATPLLTKLNTASCQAARTLGVQVNPQYGQLNYQVSSGQGLYGVTSAVAPLSGTGGTAPATTAPSLPAC